VAPLTSTDTDDVMDDDRPPPAAPQLLVLLAAQDPLRASSRHLLEGLDRVALGRGDRTRAVRTSVRGLRLLELQLDDRKASTEHARLERLGPGRWAIQDAGSKNGVHVNGDRVPRAVLMDGDLVEIGDTLLLYRDAVVPAQREVSDLAAGALDGPTAELRSFAGPAAEVFRRAGLAAGSTTPLVLLGESGTGKEVVARAVHQLSGRKGAFVAVNCGAIPPTLVEATIFGHRKGAFSDATEDRPGMVRAADGGTLFLDEIGDLPRTSQAAFLRVLQEREVVPVGETRPIKVDLRVVCATHRALPDLVERGEFRADLLARLAGVTLRLPRLADRREDLGLLIGACLRRLDGGGRGVSFTRRAALHLLRHDWPLNVRELDRALSAGITLAAGAAIDRAHLCEPDEAGAAAAPTDGASPGDRRLRAELIAHLREHDGNVTDVARAMGKGRMQIHRWLKRFSLEVKDYRR
jgi:DNA-binding NtrC family response regulator